MSRATQIVDRLLEEIPHCNDPEQLRQKADTLRAWGAWPEAEQAERKAEGLERKMAEEVMR